MTGTAAAEPGEKIFETTVFEESIEIEACHYNDLPQKPHWTEGDHLKPGKWSGDARGRNVRQEFQPAQKRKQRNRPRTGRVRGGFACARGNTVTRKALVRHH